MSKTNYEIVFSYLFSEVKLRKYCYYEQFTLPVFIDEDIIFKIYYSNDIYITLRNNFVQNIYSFGLHLDFW